MLNSLHQLTGVAVNTIHASQASLVSRPARARADPAANWPTPGQSLPLALQVLLTYPFTNQVLNDIKGDYLNAYLSLRARQGHDDHPARSCPPHRKAQALMLTRSIKVKLAAFARARRPGARLRRRSTTRTSAVTWACAATTWSGSILPTRGGIYPERRRRPTAASPSAGSARCA